MRGLAEYAMSGRRQAATIAILFGLIPPLYVISAAVVGLVTLRKGTQEGLLALLWALLPAGLQWVIGDTTPVLMLAGVMVLASVLRATGSWSRVLVVATILGLGTQLSLALQPGYIEKIEGLFTEMMAQGQTPQLVDGAQLTAATPEQVVELLLEFYGAYHMLLFVVCLIIARAWQAGLYNPGGFRQEFHSLRLDPRVAGLLLALVLAGLAGIDPLAEWISVFCMAPMFVGLAVVHCVVAVRQLGIGMLVLGYLILTVMSPAMVALGFADTIIDFRKRAAKS